MAEIILGKFIKKIISKIKPKKIDWFEDRYFKKYRHEINWEKTTDLMEKYKSTPLVFKPIRENFSQKEQERIFKKIETTKHMTAQARIEAIIAMMTILDGSLPCDELYPRLEKVFGKDFIKILKKKEEEFEKNTFGKQLVKALKSQK